MAFRILVLPSAEADIEAYSQHIAKESVEAARAWLQGLEQELNALEEMPHRFAKIPEEGQFRCVYRQAHYHSHRVIFFVDDKSFTVAIARVYHGARDRLRLWDLPR